MSLTSTIGGLLLAVTPTPAPTPPAYRGDPNIVTPGFFGFIAIFLIAVATVFLIIDMNRRIRRTRYREEIRERLAEEESAAADSAAVDDAAALRQAQGPDPERDDGSPRA